MKWRVVKAISVSMLFMLLFVACAEALLSPRAFQERRYRPCQADEIEGGVSAVAKVCFRYCAKYKALHADVSENCTLWKTDVKDLAKESDFLEFRAAGFVLINEQRIK
jgi:hypothetical protein